MKFFSDWRRKHLENRYRRSTSTEPSGWPARLPAARGSSPVNSQAVLEAATAQPSSGRAVLPLLALNDCLSLFSEHPLWKVYLSNTVKMTIWRE